LIMRGRVLWFAVVLILSPTLAVAGEGERMIKQIELKDEKFVRVKVEFGAGEINLGRTSGELLLDARFENFPEEHRPIVEYAAEKSVGSLRLSMKGEQKDFRWRNLKNKWHVRLTDRIPLALDVDMGANKADLDLTGLRIRELDLDVGASKTRIRFGKPNKEVLKEINIDTGVSKFRAEGLGNANFRHLSFDGGVGSYVLDFRGEVKEKAEVSITMGLGQLTLLIPEGVGTKIDASEVTLTAFSISGFKRYDKVYVNDIYGKTKGELFIKLESGLGAINIETVGNTIPNRENQDGNESEWKEEFWEEGLLQPSIENIRYNRVEGLFLGIGLNSGAAKEKKFGFYGHVGYGFRSDQGRYLLGIRRRWVDDLSLEVGVEGYSLTDTEDRWLLTMGENSLAAFLLKEDFYDFYLRTGGTLYGIWDPVESVRFRIDYRVDDYGSLKKTTNWALFARGKSFRPNPPVKEGTMKGLILSIGIDTRDREDYPKRGWDITFSYEYAGGGLGGDFDFHRLILDARRYQPLSPDENLDFRLRIGQIIRGANGVALPSQKLFDLGGLGSLRGYRFKEFADKDRMVLASLEYRVGDTRSEYTDTWPLKDFKIA
ncbi:MAG TPA: hypothetical protein EYP53_05860, partial [Candidatus Latescibacteria bacterium]|nr:hypothetical protein [Candidatus Latescibacterota bacterium]